MKRTPLTRKTPLAQGKPLTRKEPMARTSPLRPAAAPLSPSGGLKRGKGLKRTGPRQMAPDEKALHAWFVRCTLVRTVRTGSGEVIEVRARCIRCGKPADDPHHVIEKSFLRGQFPGRPDIWHDVRNGAPACRRCHDDHTGAARRLRIDELPAAAIAFAAEHDLTWRLERTYAPAVPNPKEHEHG